MTGNAWIGVGVVSLALAALLKAWDRRVTRRSTIKFYDDVSPYLKENDESHVRPLGSPRKTCENGPDGTVK